MSEVTDAAVTVAGVPPISTVFSAGVGLNPSPVSVALCPSTSVSGCTLVRVRLVDVALKATGDPVREPDCASSVCSPRPDPSVHTVCACPVEPVDMEAGVTEPPPPVTTKSTVRPDTGLPS